MTDPNIAIPLPLVITALGLLMTGLWYYFKKAADTQERRLRELVEDNAALANRVVSVEKDVIRLQGKLDAIDASIAHSVDTVNGRSDSQDKMLLELLEHQRQLAEAIAKKVSKDTWLAAQTGDPRREPDSDPPPLPPMRPKFTTHRGPLK